MLKEFKEFISEGNIMEVAVAFIMGLAIKGVIDSFVDDVIMKIIGAIVGKPSFRDLTFKLGDGVVTYGNFLTVVVNFLIIAAVLFLMLKAYNKMVAMKGPKPEEAAEADELQLLTEIRDALRARQ